MQKIFAALMQLDINMLQHRLHSRLAEWSMAVSMLFCAFALLYAPVFELPPYEITSRIADQAVVAWTMLLVSGARIVVLAINGTLPRGSPHLRSGLASVSALIWSAMLAGYFAYDAVLLIGAILFAHILTDLANAYRAAQDAGKEDDLWGRHDGHSG